MWNVISIINLRTGDYICRWGTDSPASSYGQPAPIGSIDDVEVGDPIAYLVPDCPWLPGDIIYVDPDNEWLVIDEPLNDANDGGVWAAQPATCTGTRLEIRERGVIEYRQHAADDPNLSPAEDRAYLVSLLTSGQCMAMDTIRFPGSQGLGCTF